MSVMKGIYWPQNNSRLLGGMESQKMWVATADLERNKTPSESLGSGLWIAVKIIPLKCKDSIRVLVLLAFNHCNKKIKTMHSCIERL